MTYQIHLLCAPVSAPRLIEHTLNCSAFHEIYIEISSPPNHTPPRLKTNN